jgi:hypothetical protein
MAGDVLMPFGNHHGQSLREVQVDCPLWLARTVKLSGGQVQTVACGSHERGAVRYEGSLVPLVLPREGWQGAVCGRVDRFITPRRYDDVLEALCAPAQAHATVNQLGLGLWLLPVATLWPDRN